MILEVQASRILTKSLLELRSVLFHQCLHSLKMTTQHRHFDRGTHASEADSSHPVAFHNVQYFTAGAVREIKVSQVVSFSFGVDRMFLLQPVLTMRSQGKTCELKERLKRHIYNR